MWKVLKNLLKQKPKSSNQIRFGSELIDDHVNITNRFNTCFIESINETIPQVDFDDSEVVYSPDVELKQFKAITRDQLLKTVKSIKPTSTVDNISVKVLLDTFDVIGGTLLNVINDSLRTGIVPDTFKIFMVVPIPKVNNTNKCEEYRPINMLPVCEKCTELVVKDQLVDFLDKNNVLAANQSGLAFETVDRGILLKKLRAIGIRESALAWFASYLSNRFQYTRYEKSKSVKLPNDLGVPQGSVLGPILFIIYKNDISSSVLSSELNLFADDTLVAVADSSFEQAVETVT